ncbi:hypothetical protein HII31_02823 [Pseudocercospora fuligena]|uniref:Uncharacterized protein n=1 Tax=Pseudocercospora fuligena TaxID=685502 RepID=A0A8H6RRH1_9PEZI|nr:hypothetical protein HII31_02823 [Pseudocercospora fuligena]
MPNEISHVRTVSAPPPGTDQAKISPSRTVAVKRTIRVPGQGNIYENDDFSQEWSLFMHNPRLWLRRLLKSTFGSLRQVPSMVVRICGRKRNAEEAFLDATDVIPETQHTHASAAPMPAFRDVTEAVKAHDRAIKESQALARMKQLDDEAELERQREANHKVFLKWRLGEMAKYLKQSTQRRNALQARQEEDAISSKMQASEISDDDFDYLADLFGSSMDEEELLYLLKCAEDGVLPVIELSAQNIHKAWALLHNQKFAAKEPALHAHLCLHMVPVLERLQFKLFASTLHDLNLFEEELLVMYHFLSGQGSLDFPVTPTTAARAQYLSFHPLIRDQYPQLALAIEVKARFAVDVVQQSESMDVDMSIESPAAVASRNDNVDPIAGVQSVSWPPLAMDGVIADAAEDESLAYSPEPIATTTAFNAGTTGSATHFANVSSGPAQETGAAHASTPSEGSSNAPLSFSGTVQAPANHFPANKSISVKAKEGTLRLKLERIRDQVEPQVGNALKSNDGHAYQAAVLAMTKDLVEARNFANEFNSSSFDKFLDEQDLCEGTGVPRKQFWIGGGHLKDYENKAKTLTAKMQYIRNQLEPELAIPWAAGDLATSAPLIDKMTNALIEAKNIANILGSSAVDDFLKEQDPIDPDSNPRGDFWAERVYGD